MITLLIFALTLLLAILLSGLARRSVLSTAVLFLAAGFLFGKCGWNVLGFTAKDQLVERFIEVALFSVLFIEGMEVELQKLAAEWALPARALFLGMPLTLVGGALLAHFVVNLSWPHAFIVGAILSPTDPVFAAAIVGQETVPARLRRLLKIESGLNDGLALPLVLLAFAVAGDTETSLTQVIEEIILGVVIGIAVPWVVITVERIRWFQSSDFYRPLSALAMGLLVFAFAHLLPANEFLAAFSAGITIVHLNPQLRDAFKEFGELIAELLKLGGVLIFSALISIEAISEIPYSGFLFVLLVLFALRPLAMGLALIGTALPVWEWITVVWFGPRGFASVFYGLLLLQTSIDNANQIFHLIAMVIVVSIVAHSSTDTLIARWFRKQERDTVP